MLSAIKRIAQTENHPFYDGFDVQKWRLWSKTTGAFNPFFERKKSPKKHFLKA
jgi:hypothetical protein